MPLFSKGKDSECLLVFDIGSGSVGGAIVFAPKDRIPAILYSFRSSIPFQGEATGPRLLSLMLRALTEVVLALCREGFATAGLGSKHPRIKEAIVSLSAPWIVSKTSSLQLHSREPMTITGEVFASLLSHSAEEIRPSGATVPKNGVQVEQRLIKSILNGYETSFPYEKEARDAEFVIVSSFSVPKVTEGIADTITRLVQPKAVNFHSFALVAFMALRRLHPRSEHFMLVDVSGEQTELCIVRKGILIQTITFPFGRNHLIRTLKRNAGVPASGAEAFFKLYADASGTGKTFERIKTVLEHAEEHWRNEFVRALAGLSEELFLPASLFLAADSDVLPIFKRAIEQGDWSSFRISRGAFRITPITAESLASLIRWDAAERQDPFITLVSSFASRSHS